MRCYCREKPWTFHCYWVAICSLERHNASDPIDAFALMASTTRKQYCRQSVRPIVGESGSLAEVDHKTLLSVQTFVHGMYKWRAHAAFNHHCKPDQD